MTIKLRCNKNPWSSRVEILIIDVPDRGKTGVARPIVFDKVEDGEIINPSLSIDASAAQELMDSLWFSGVRPSDGNGNVGQLQATERHLQDMRRLVFDGK